MSSAILFRVTIWKKIKIISLLLLLSSCSTYDLNITHAPRQVDEYDPVISRQFQLYSQRIATYDSIIENDLEKQEGIDEVAKNEGRTNDLEREAGVKEKKKGKTLIIR